MPKPSLCYFCDKPCEGSYNGTPTCWACWPVEQAKPVSTPSPADLPARKAPTTFADVVNEAIAPADVACQWPDCDCTCPEDSECVNYNACKGLPATRQCGIKGCNCMGLDPITPAAGLSYDVLRLHADGSTTVETHRIAQGP